MRDAISILEDARQHIEQGWTTGTFESYGGNVCAVGALHKAGSGSANFPFPSVAYIRASRALSAAAHARGSASVVGYNDSRRGIHGQGAVASLFTDAIGRLQGSGSQLNAGKQQLALPAPPPLTLKERLERQQAKRRAVSASTAESLPTTTETTAVEEICS